MKAKKRKKNPVLHMRESDKKNLQREAVDQSYRLFMVTALTTLLDKHDAGTGNAAAVDAIVRRLAAVRDAHPETAAELDSIISSIEALAHGAWLMDVVQEMNELIGEIDRGMVSVDDLAGVLEDEYEIVLRYRAI